MNQPWRVLQVITIALSASLLVLIGVVAVDANRDRAQEQASAELAACRAKQSSDFNEEAWSSLARLFGAAFRENEQQVGEHVDHLVSLTPLSERIRRNC